MSTPDAAAPTGAEDAAAPHPILNFLNMIMPPPATALSRDYEGPEFRWKVFTFRPKEFWREGIVAGLCVLYLTLFFIGKLLNNYRAKATASPLRPLLEAQFARVRPLVASSPAKQLLFATGRRNVLWLHATITLWPIQDIVGLGRHLLNLVLEPTYDASETITLEFTLGKGEEGLQGEGVGVWGVISKNALRQVRQQRYDVTFPKLNDSTPAIPPTHALLTEHSDCSDLLLKTPNIGIADLLQSDVAASSLKFLLVSDQPAIKPRRGAQATREKSRAVVLSVYKPRSAAAQSAVIAWTQVALNIADLLGKPGVVKPEVTRKLQRTRQQVDTDLSAEYKKLVAQDKPAELTAEEKRAEKKRLERAAMTEQELKKREELEKKREMRKQQKKQMTR